MQNTWLITSVTMHRDQQNVRYWHIPVGLRPAYEWLLSGVELPLDAGSAAIRSRAAALDALLNRQFVTRIG